MNFNVVRIESQTVGSNTFPTYFVDLLNVQAMVSKSAGNLFKTEDKQDARDWARAYADANGLRVEDETLVQEMIAAYKARGCIADAKYKAASDEALEQAILRSTNG